MNGLFKQWWRLGGLLGIAFVVMFIVVGFAVQGETPMHNDNIDEIRDFWVNDGENYLLGDYILGLSSLLLYLPFLCALRALLGGAEGGVQLWSRVAFGAGFLLLVVAATASASWTALAFAAEDMSDESIQLLMYLDLGAWNAFPFTAGTLLLASSLVIYRTAVLWRSLAILGAIVGVLALITPAGIIGAEPTDDVEEGFFGIIGFISFIGLALWLLLVSVAMLMKQSEPIPAARTEAAL